MIAVLAELPLPWPFDREYMQLALWPGLVVGGCAPLIGAFLVQKRLSLMGDGIGHIAFAGVAAGLLSDVWPIWTALVAAVAGAVAVEWLRSRRPDVAATSPSPCSSTRASPAAWSSPAWRGSLNGGLLTYLFGSILTVSPSDVVDGGGLGAAILAHRRPRSGGPCSRWWSTRSRPGWRACPSTRLNLALAALAALTVVAAMRVVGVLLVAALMVLPVGAAQRLARSFRATLLIAGAIGAASAVSGLAAARESRHRPGRHHRPGGGGRLRGGHGVDRRPAGAPRAGRFHLSGEA